MPREWGAPGNAVAAGPRDPEARKRPVHEEQHGIRGKGIDIEAPPLQALGTGWRKGVRWVDIEVARNSSGKPSIVLSGRSREIADQFGVKHVSLSITHSGNTAFAEVIFES